MAQLISEKRFLEITNQFESLAPICVLGDVGIDKYTYGEVRKISPEAPVPVLEVRKEWLKLGLAANISHNLQTLNIQSTLCGVIGNDAHASVFENLLEESGLKIWGLVRDESRPTIFKERVTTNVQQICRIDYEVLTPISQEIENSLLTINDDFFSQHQALIIEDYAKGTLTKGLIRKSMDKYIEAKKIVAIDPGSSTPPLFYKGATLLKPNLKEANLMVQALGHQEKDLEVMARLLVDKLKLEKLVITLGGEGMAMIDTLGDGKLKIIPTVANEVFDVSGAGDTAISLLTASLMAGATLEEAAWVGNCGSGVVVGKKGTATVSLIELQEFHQDLLRSFKKKG